MVDQHRFTEARGPGGRARATSVAIALLVAAVIARAGKPILVPLALALLATAALSPAVDLMTSKRVPRQLAVAVTMLLVFLAAGVLALVVGRQLPALSASAVAYRQNVGAKIAEVRELGRSPTIRNIRAVVSGVQQEIEKGEPAAKEEAVVVEEGGIARHIPPLIELGATALLVVVLVGFFLARQPELRARTIRLFGHAQLAVTTKALDEASSLISRYLRSLCLVNGCFGLAAAAGMMLLGVPFAPLLAILAAALRFIPYLGAWAGALTATFVSLAAFPGWGRAIAVGLMFAVLEPLTGMVAEPLVFGQRLGLSDVGVLVAAMTWTWLWGPAGLLLATPITVCLVVLGRAVPSLAFLDVIFGEARPLPPPRAFYERLLVGDADAADEVLATFSAERPREELFDGLLMPAVLQAARDREAGHLTTAEMRSFMGSLQLAVRPYAGQGPPDAGLPAITGVAVGDEADEMALWLLRGLLAPDLELDVVPAVERPWRLVGRPAAICLLSVHGGSGARLRRIFEELRARCPEAPILLCQPGSRGAAVSVRGLEIVASLGEARARLLRLPARGAGSLAPDERAPIIVRR